MYLDGSDQNDANALKQYSQLTDDHFGIWNIWMGVFWNFLYRLYLHGSLLEDMIQENMSKFMDKMVKETESFTPKQYFSLMIFHQLYTICFGEWLVFE